MKSEPDLRQVRRVFCMLAECVRLYLPGWWRATPAVEFILRIEDFCDRVSEVQGSADHIQESLKWLGLDWDMGPDKPKAIGPFFQSQRLEIYKHWAQKLVDSGKAYADPYTPETLQMFRDKAKVEKRPFLFRNHRPDKPPATIGRHTTPQTQIEPQILRVARRSHWGFARRTGSYR